MRNKEGQRKRGSERVGKWNTHNALLPKWSANQLIMVMNKL